MLQLILNNLFNKINCDVLRDDNGMVHQKMFYAIYEKNLVNHDWLRVLLPYLLYSVSEFLLTIFLISDLLSQAVVDAEKPAPNGIAADNDDDCHYRCKSVEGSYTNAFANQTDRYLRIIRNS